MREAATLRLDSGREVRVDVELDSLDDDTIVVSKRLGDRRPTKPMDAFLRVLDAHLETAQRHPAGTTDRLLAEDRNRRY